MEKEINIAEILKDSPRCIKLYSPIFGDVTFDKVEKDLGEYTIFVTDKGQNHQTFMTDGRYNRNGVPVLFPSKEMHNWSKFAWKKGDVLISNDGKTKAVFDGFKDETYASFVGRHALYYLDNDDTMYYDNVDFYKTDFFYIEDEKNAIQRYFNTLEKKLDGKLNMETLEVEKVPYLNLKDGDIVTWAYGMNPYIGIAIGFTPSKKEFCLYALLMDETLETPSAIDHHFEYLRYATNEEKQQLFKALAKEGKRWNTETKQIEDIKLKCELKPFDKVVVRDKDSRWSADFFSFKGSTFFVCIGGSWDFCLPYNEETAKLIGTTNNYKED